MLRMTLATAALATAAVICAGPTLADDTCLTDTRGVQCDLFLGAFRADEVPVGTTDVRPTEKFVVERDEDLRLEHSDAFPGEKEVMYWDGEKAMIVPEDTGPRLEIADW